VPVARPLLRSRRIDELHEAVDLLVEALDETPGEDPSRPQTVALLGVALRYALS
jgi:hypothetical protein